MNETQLGKFLVGDSKKLTPTSESQFLTGKEEVRGVTGRLRSSRAGLRFPGSGVFLQRAQ